VIRLSGNAAHWAALAANCCFQPEAMSTYMQGTEVASDVTRHSGPLSSEAQQQRRTAHRIAHRAIDTGFQDPTAFRATLWHPQGREQGRSPMAHNRVALWYSGYQQV
jgi:hypothetical protein